MSQRAIQLASEGKSTIVGESVEYVFTNARHTNPLLRVIPKAIVEQMKDYEYDKEKYREMLLEASGNSIEIFRF